MGVSDIFGPESSEQADTHRYMASMAIQYDKPRIRLIFRLRLGKIDLSEPLDCDVVVCPAVVGRDVIPVGHLPELIDKPLLLKLFAFEYNPRFQKTASCSRGFDKASPSAGLRALEEVFLLGSLLPITKESKPMFPMD